MTQVNNLGEFKKNLGEKLQGVEGLPGSEKIQKQYKSALFREIVADPEYQQLKKEYLNEKRSKNAKEKLFQETFIHAQKINPSLTEEDLRALLMGQTEPKESKETLTNLPSDVATQEKKAIAYFEKNSEFRYLEVVDHIKKLRRSRNITYEDLGGGKYNVIMPYGSKKLKMYFPADTTLADDNYEYIDFDDEKITRKETTRKALGSEKGQKYLERKEKKGQKMLSKSEFETLIQSLYPQGTEEEQILAFMRATGFYGRIRLSDKTSDYQLAVQCYSKSNDRMFYNLNKGSSLCGLVHSTFVE